jgi:hypothetical protein
MTRVLKAAFLAVAYLSVQAYKCALNARPRMPKSLAIPAKGLAGHVPLLIGGTLVAAAAMAVQKMEGIRRRRRLGKLASRNKSFIFDESRHNDTSDNLHIVRAVLTGLASLPSERSLLLPGTQQGRGVHYKTFNRVSPVWESLEGNVTSAFSSASRATLSRVLDGRRQLGSCRMYKFQLSAADMESISRISQERLRQYRADNEQGIAVSNAGGFHSLPNAFNETVFGSFGALCALAVDAAERDDFISVSDPRNELRRFQPFASADAWLNCNRHGNWNSMHTHTGDAWSGMISGKPVARAWSGIYYVQTAVEVASREYSGRLLIKPSPHASEAKDVTRLERLRLNPQGWRDLDLTRCDYLEIAPESGMLLVFPSYLQHAVLPMCIKEEFRDSTDRISLAFNFAMASESK